MAKLTLDKPREIRFDFDAFVALDEKCGININDTRSWSKLSPVQLRDLAWAGQIGTAKPLDREDVGKFIPTDHAGMQEFANVIVDAIIEAKGWKKKDASE